MSKVEPQEAAGLDEVVRVTPQFLRRKKHSRSPITALTAYDYPTAYLADESGIDVLLVGDSLGMVVLGHENTLALTLEEMLHHARAVRKATRRAMLVADLPYGSYHVNTEDTVRNGIRLVKEAGVEAVKLEGGISQAPAVRALIGAQVPVLGHIGLMPQSVLAMGGYRVQGTTETDSVKLLEDAQALAEAGVIALVLEGISREAASEISERVAVPTIGIGAGPNCDGQILVFHDLFGLSFQRKPRFVRRFGDAASLMRAGILGYRNAVQSRSFPSDAESYHMSPASSKC